MTPERYRECLEILGWSMRRLARYLTVSDTSTRRYASGKQEIPENLAEWLEYVTTARDMNRALKTREVPDGWDAVRELESS